MDTLTLNLRDMLPTIREAFDAGNLQVQDKARWPARDTGKSGTYAGPCAIGVCLDEKTRSDWDTFANSSIRQLYYKSLFVTDDIDDLAELQATHDAGVGCYDAANHEDAVNLFAAKLAGLEAKYGGPAT